MSHAIDWYSFLLSGQVAVVTGAAGGIGSAISQRFVRQGVRVAMLDNREDVLAQAEFLGQDAALGIVTDVTDPVSVASAVEQILGHFGKVDILINSAGVLELCSAENMTDEIWDRTLATNLTGVRRMCQAVARSMLRAGYGRIVNIAGQGGTVALERQAAYCVSMAGVIALTRALALEWSPRGVNVNVISPAVVMTGMGRQLCMGAGANDLRMRTPTRRFAEPEEIAMAALFLASNSAGMITGENLVVDGGYSIQ
ncbi:MAG: D-threitol dehydrogenase [Marinobacter sp.]|uniref:GolD/DthD family dehydrogenase n=1 Tax=Marinobacter sp. TaxID=50741 RepID=UPI00299E3AB5|nr:D-threitol dehydrogenase [Marinobacter sp.]MDX1635646.1 D-threitol dehydrogenase [Marinobacter sp.]